MEKLQKALSKARQTRSGTPDAPRTRRPAPEAAPVSAFPPIWDELAPYEPNPDLLLRNRIMTLNAQTVSNPFDILRTKVFLMMQQNGWTRLAITSPTKACGKTTTACNLAVGLSRQRENRSMLFDMDLRRPSVANMLGRKPEHSIKSLLTGEVPAQDQILRLRTNVALSMAREPVSDPAQLLLARKTAETFDQLQHEFDPDIMIFDLPPMLVTDDARAFLKNVDCTLIVARAEHTKMSQLDICEREVSEQSNVLGVVLNSCRHVSEEEQYYGAYE